MTDTDTSSPKRAMRGAARILHDILDDLHRSGAGRQHDAQSHEGEAAPSEPKAKLGDLIDRLDERAFGLLLLLLALPCCLPFVYLLPQIVALPMLALAGQLAAGRKHPWLPGGLHERKFSVPAFQRVVARSEKYLGWIDTGLTIRLLPLELPKIRRAGYYDHNDLLINT